MMPRRLRRFFPPVLGLTGGSIGLFFAYATLSQSNPGCSCDWFNFQLYFGLLPLIGGTAGLAGAGLYLISRRLGGIFMVGGGIMASTLALFVAAIFLINPSSMISILYLLGAALVVSPSLLMFAGGS